MGCFGDVGEILAPVAKIAAPIVGATNPLAGAAMAVGGSLVGGSHADDAIGSATDAQVAGANAATALQQKALDQQWNMYQQNRADLAPFRSYEQAQLNRSTRNLNTLENLIKAGPGNFQASPGYQFSFDQGVQARDRSAAARGRLNSGAQDKALTRYGQGMANQEYDNFLNRYYQSLTPYQSLTGTSQTATNTGIQAGQNMSNSLTGIYNKMAGNQISAGDARASGYIGQANAQTGTGNDLARIAGGIDWGGIGQQVSGWFDNPGTSPANTNYSSLWNG